MLGVIDLGVEEGPGRRGLMDVFGDQGETRCERALCGFLGYLTSGGRSGPEWQILSLGSH
jgi:hypothetical protein